MSTSRRPVVYALLAAALFGAATPASKVLLMGLTSFQLAGLLYLGAALGVATGSDCSARSPPGGSSDPCSCCSVFASRSRRRSPCG
jgi:hypothetical protein